MFDPLTPAQSPRHCDLLVVGAGFSGSLLLAHLARSGRVPAHTVWLESQPAAGVGRAWPTDWMPGLANVRAGHLSAWPDAPGDFLDHWAAETGQPATALSLQFPPRADYTGYLQQIRRTTLQHWPATAQLHCATADVLDVQPDGDHWQVTLDNGQCLRARNVVLATGHGTATHPLSAGGGLRDPLLANSWEDLDPQHAVLVIGSGLTAVDTLQQLQARGHRGPITVVSRHGRWPQPHLLQPGPAHVWPASGFARTLRGLLRQFRQHVQAYGDWRAVLDGLRPHSNGLWARLSVSEQHRFQRHLRHHWDRHRHRSAPAVWASLQDWMQTHPVHVQRGSVLGCRPDAGRHWVHWRQPDGRSAALTVDQVYDARARCALDAPLVRRLRERGQVQAHPTGLGLCSTAEGSALDARQRVQAGLYLIGPLRQGALLESTAIPELRVQAAQLASHLLTTINALPA